MKVLLPLFLELILVSSAIASLNNQTNLVMVNIIDQDRKPVDGVRIRVKENGTESRPTQNGRCLIQISKEKKPGARVPVELINASNTSWVIIDDEDAITVPTNDVTSPDRTTTMHVMRRGDLGIASNPAAMANSLSRVLKSLSPGMLERSITPQQRQAVVNAEARRLGLTRAQYFQAMKLGLAAVRGAAEQARVRMVRGEYLAALAYSQRAVEESAARRVDAISDLALNEYLIGQYANAARDYKLALEGRPDSPEIMADYGVALILNGDYREARSVLARALGLVERTQPNSHTAYLINIQLSWALSCQAELVEARQHVEKAEQIAKKIAKPISREMAGVYNALATLDIAQKEYTPGIRRYMQAQAIYNKLPGARLEGAQLLLNIADAYLEAADLNKALASLDMAGTRLQSLVKRKVIPHSHPVFADLHNLTAGVYDRRHDFTQARAEFEKALAILQANKMTEHPMYATVLSNLAKAYHHAHQIDKSITTFERVLAIRIPAVGSDHPDVARTYASLAVDYYEKGNLVDALSNVNKAVDLLSGRVGFEDVLAAAYNNRGGIFKAVNRMDEASADFLKALHTYGPFKKYMPLEYSETLANLSDLKRGDEAVSLSKEAVDIRRAFKGLDPDALVEVLLPYGLAFARIGRTAEAEAVWREAVTLADHPPARLVRGTALNNLGELYRLLKRWQESEDLLTRSLNNWHDAGFVGTPNMLKTCNHYRQLFLDQKLAVKAYDGCPRQ